MKELLTGTQLCKTPKIVQSYIRRPATTETIELPVREEAILSKLQGMKLHRKSYIKCTKYVKDFIEHNKFAVLGP